MIMKKVISEIYCLILLIFSLLSRSRFVVRGNSMLPTFSDSDKFIINRFRYIFFNPKRGDIVCFKANWGINNIYLKRIIGLPGESIELNGNEIYIDGVKYYNYDIEDVDKITESVDICFHLCAMARVQPSFEDPMEYFHILKYHQNNIFLIN